MNSDDDGGKAAEEDADDIENACVIAVGEPSNPCFKYTMDMYTKKKLLKKIV